ncbi:S41 family peptidase [Lewinella sp. IMCC34183]|uniref:S41 family peptidase n=1 Tax=Lewinella sp. IMCC34183 TaxID=2248762 RepID=UPI000E26A518|nr:S41 family peptidase [Lewinella sp. IMCC34183]
MKHALLAWFTLLLAGQLPAQLYDLFGSMQPTYARVNFIGQYGHLPTLGSEANESMIAGLAQLELSAVPGVIRIGDNYLDTVSGTSLLSLRAPNGEAWFGIWKPTDPAADLRRIWGHVRGVYSGIDSPYSVYYPESDTAFTMQFVFHTDSTIVAGGVKVATVASPPAFEWRPTSAEEDQYERALARLATMVDQVYQVSVDPADTVYAAHPDRQLTADERVYGLVQFWTDVKYNFAFFDQVPDLNWDAKLLEYLPLVREADSDYTYFRLLQRLCAQLQDGHTNVYPPGSFYRTRVAPPVRIGVVDGQFIVENVDSSLLAELPLGSTITAVGGVDIDPFVTDSIYPYLSAGSDHVRRIQATNELLRGREGTVEVTAVTPAGETVRTRLQRPGNRQGTRWARTDPQLPPARFALLADGVGYLQLNTFADPAVADSFQVYRPQLEGANALVIDLRNNGGGNSSVGYDVLRHFLQDPVVTSAWRTREHRSAFQAWGQYYADKGITSPDDFTQRALRTFRGDFWYYGDADTLTPADTVYHLPVAVLVSHQTASAAEDFLVAADAVPTFTYVGEASFGSTGQPLAIFLPGGASARVCTKRDTYADGREFVGPGVQVDVEAQPSVADFLAERDVVLEAALELLRSKR